MTDKVYRVENPDRVGPYVCDPQCPPFGGLNTTDKIRQPVPLNDGMAEYEFKAPISFYRYGFASKAAITKWFNAVELAYLAARGFCVATYRAAHVIRGGHQVAFLPDEKLAWEPLPVARETGGRGKHRSGVDGL